MHIAAGCEYGKLRVQPLGARLSFTPTPPRLWGLIAGAQWHQFHISRGFRPYPGL